MKKFFICAAVAAAAVFGVMKANDVNTNSKMSDLQLENVDALADPPEYNVSVPFYCVGGGPCATLSDGFQLQGVMFGL